MPKLSITVQHGESGSVFYVVDASRPEPEQPAVVASFGTMGAARSYVMRQFRTYYVERRIVSATCN